MRHVINKISVVFMASIFALSGLSVAYSAWTDTLYIQGTVTTGTLEWEFGPSPPTITDVYAPPTPTPDWNCDPNLGFNGPYPQPYVVDKNIGWGDTYIEDHDTIQLHIYSAYPGYYNHLDFWVHCLGTIPLKTDHAVVTNATGIVIATITGLGLYEFDISGDGVNDMQILWGDNFGTQLHYCQSQDISFGFCFLQPLPLNSDITIYINLVCVQWNEYPLP
jgi:hypothetical protein